MSIQEAGALNQLTEGEPITTDMAADCLEGFTGACSRSWTCMSETAVSAWRWMCTHVFYSPCICAHDDDKSHASKRPAKPQVRSNESSPLASPPSKLFKGQQPPPCLPPPPQQPQLPQQQPQQPQSQSQTQPPMPQVTTQNYTVKEPETVVASAHTTAHKQAETRSSGSLTMAEQQVAQSNRQTTTTTNQQPAGTKEAARSRSDSPRPRAAPPKIDFVETGSIFGDRKRPTHTSMLLMDNGRFKSPGRPNVLTGPGGRSIRISFQTGFPSIKSIESRAPPQSLASKISLRSGESGSSKETSSLGDSDPDAPKRAFQKRKKKKLTYKSRRSSKSVKSYKSYASKITKEPEVEQQQQDFIEDSNVDEPAEEVIRSIESIGNKP